MNIKYYISYPIRYILRHKVERYKKELEQIEARKQIMLFKARGCGKTMTNFSIMSRDMLLSVKYKGFIKKWSLK